MSVAGDTGASKGKTLTDVAAARAGPDSFTGRFENDPIGASAEILFA